MDARGRIIELQSTAEKSGLSREQLSELLDMAAAGIEQLMALQRAAVESAGR